MKNLKKSFVIGSGLFEKKEFVNAVQDVSFDIRKGETFSLVGESGCGKSTTGRLINRLIEPTSGEIYLNGESVREKGQRELKEVRKKVQMIFQDPYASLNPRMKVRDLIGEPLDIQFKLTSSEREEKIREMSRIVGLNPEQLDRFPHEFSGGQRQRIGIARALITNPELIIADEPVSALDVSIQSQILNLLNSLKKEFNISYLFISHDLSVVEHLSDRIAVMYLGTIVEVAERDDLFRNPLHPYTQALLSSIPVPNPKERRERIILRGDLPNPKNPPSGCSFHTRCPYATDKCRTDRPRLEAVPNGHKVACHYAKEGMMNNESRIEYV